jgi:hypothetical protein
LSFFFQHLLKDKAALRVKDFPATSRRSRAGTLAEKPLSVILQNDGFEKRLIPRQKLVH